jgi:hypothetical protein
MPEARPTEQEWWTLVAIDLGLVRSSPANSIDEAVFAHGWAVQRDWGLPVELTDAGREVMRNA